MQQKPIFLSGLNGIRTIAAIGVMISHINIALNSYFNISNFSLFGFDANGNQKGWILGEHGVTMFFVLSGFLITFLLLKEKDKTNAVNIKAFYMRRLLRIWPLYYLYFLITIAVLLLFYNFGFNKDFIYYIFFMANVPFIRGEIYPGLNHLWSIAVEEQFYLFWPFLFLLAKKNLKIIIIILIITLGIIRILLWTLYPFSAIAILANVNRFDCMMFGALLAILYNKNDNLLSFLNSKLLQAGSWIIVFLMFINVFRFLNSIIEIFVITFVTGVLIIGQINIKNRIFNLEQKFISYLGRLSFGIYVYHPLIIVVLSLILRDINLPFGDALNAILLFIIITSLTIGISHISYYKFEAYFLKFKNKFSVVKSTNENNK